MGDLVSGPYRLHRPDQEPELVWVDQRPDGSWRVVRAGILVSPLEDDVVPGWRLESLVEELGQLRRIARDVSEALSGGEVAPADLPEHVAHVGRQYARAVADLRAERDARRAAAICVECAQREPVVDDDGLCCTCGGDVVVGALGDVEAVERLLQRLTAAGVDL